MSQIKPMGTLRQKQPRIHNEAHLKAIRQCNCLVCGKFQPSEAAHIRYGDTSYGKFATGMGQKPDDKWTVPLCADCHRNGSEKRKAQHQMNERKFWEQEGIDPLEVAIELFACDNHVTRMQDMVSDNFIMRVMR